MTTIQVLLVTAICILVALYFRSFRNQASKRLFFLFIFALGVVFVLLPDFTNRVAHILGIGRGADLLLYFSVIGGFLVLVLINAKFKKLERALTEIARRQAILNAKEPIDSKESGNPDR